MASSSSSKRSRGIAESGKCTGQALSKAICFLSPFYSCGSLKVLENFARSYGSEISEIVYLHLPSGSIWYGTYDHVNRRIEGLNNFIRYYNLKPYDMVTFAYLGGSDFSIELYNCYAVEIYYGVKDIAFVNGVCCVNHVGSAVDDVSEIHDFELDKRCATVSYNCKSTGFSSYELVITSTLLKNAKYTEVLRPEACGQLGLNESMKWVHIGFQKFFWHIKLKWDAGHVFFDNEWTNFAKANKLRTGDTCILSYRPGTHQLKMAVFKNGCMGSFCRGGEIGVVKGMMKFYQIMNANTLMHGELKLPRLFVHEFGRMLGADIRLCLGDGNQFSVTFSSATQTLLGLNCLFESYSVEEEYFLFFDYVGRSTFYVSIYSSGGLEIFNGVDQKLMLKDLKTKLEAELSLEDNGGLNETEVASTGPFFPENDLNSRKNGVESCQTINSFTTVLKPSNVDHTGHGVYIERHLLPVYRSWSKATIVKLFRRGKS